VKVRVRFGIRLGWPITNAATFVFYTQPNVFDKLSLAVENVRTYLTMAGKADLAARLVCEES